MWSIELGTISRLVDRFFVFLLVASIIFEPFLPQVSGNSIAFLVFLITGVYVLAFRTGLVRHILITRYFLVVVAFAVVCVFMESLHPYPDYKYIIRFLNMSAGIFIVSLLCRTYNSVETALYSFLICTSIASLYLLAEPNSILKSINAEGFNEASKARILAFESTSIKDYLNDFSMYSSIGALIGIIYWYFEKSKARKILLGFLIAFSLVGVFLPASRTGAMIFFLGFVFFIYKARVPVRRYWLPLGLLSILLIFFIPDVVWVRIGSLFDLSEIQQVDSRAKLYKAIFYNLDDYIVAGVGSGMYWKNWAVNAGITNIHNIAVPMSAHNAYFQIWIYWGLPAIVLFLYMIWVFSRALSAATYFNQLQLTIYVFMVLIPIVFIVYPAFYQKAFSVGVGLLLALRLWDIKPEYQSMRYESSGN